MLYREWWNEWMELYVKTIVNGRTYRKYRREAEKYILPDLGDTDVEAFTALGLQKFSAALASRQLAANTVNGILCRLKSSLKKAAALGIAKRQFTDAIIRPKAREKRVDCFGKEEQRRLEQYILRHRTARLSGILLCLYTGLRIGELLALTWEDIDFLHGTVAVKRSCHDGWENGHYVKIFDATKTQSSERVIPLPRQLAGLMREVKRNARGKFVVAGRTGAGAPVRSYQRTFDALLKKLGIAHRGFHALRHTFATRALEIGMDVKTLSEVLGHKNPVVTLQRYAHSMSEHKTEMMNRVGRLLQ